MQNKKHVLCTLTEVSKHEMYYFICIACIANILPATEIAALQYTNIITHTDSMT